MTIIQKLSEPDLVLLLLSIPVTVLVIAWLAIRSVRDVKVAKYSYQAQMHSQETAQMHSQMSQQAPDQPGLPDAGVTIPPGSSRTHRLEGISSQPDQPVPPEGPWER